MTEIEVAYRSPGSFLVAYATHLADAKLFVPTKVPLHPGAPVRLRMVIANLRPQATVLALEGKVTAVRPAAGARPGGATVALSTPLSQALGATVDGLASSFARLQVSIGAGEAAARAILGRYLRSILSCDVRDLALERRIGEDAALEDTDLAVIDLDSSGAAGPVLLARLRADSRTASTPVVALAHMERDRVAALRAGCEEAVANPPVLVDLEAAVLRALAAPAVA